MRSDLKRLSRDTDSGRSSAMSAAAATGSGTVHVELAAPKTGAGWRSTLIAAGAAVLLLGGVYTWRLATHHAPMTKPPMTQRQLTANPAGYGVNGTAVSPDGKYLAYSDDMGLHIKLVETGEMRTLPLPTEAASAPTSSTLLRVDLQGHATPLWDQRGAWRTWAIAAPNGRELAIQGMTSSSNVWM